MRRLLGVLIGLCLATPAYAGSLFVPMTGAGSGDIIGPAIAVDNALVRFDGTTGKLMQAYTSGSPTCGDTGICTFANTTASTSITTGSVIVTGGVGITGRLNVGGTINQYGTTTPSHLASGQTTAPALTSCGTGSPTNTGGTDTAGLVTMGTSATGCIITFNAAYTTAPFCTVTWIATPLASQSYVVSTTAITLTQTDTSGNVAVYHCIAPSGG